MTDTARLAASLTGRYTIDRQVGRGGMATVFLAHDEKHDRDVAIKVLHEELAAAVSTERFHREIKIQAKLRHPHVVPLLDSGEADGQLYYIMPYVEGESLRQHLARGRMEVAEVLRLWRDVVDGIAYAHRHGVAHRDIKPENVLVSERHALVADFGVAKALTVSANTTGGGREETLTSAGVAIGTPAYMSPEQVSGSSEVDARSDIYALGVLAYEMLSGKPPFSAPSPAAVFMAQISETPKPIEDVRPDVPPALAAAIQRCMEKDPARRWSTADELLAELDTLASQGDAPARRASSRRWIAAGAAALAIVVAAGLYLNWRQSRVSWARATALPELRRLSDAMLRDSAFVLIARVKEILPNDPEVQRLARLNTAYSRLVTVPAGARVSWTSYSADTSNWRFIGETPLDSVPIPPSTPQALPLLKIEKAGYATALVAGAATTGANPLTLELAPAAESTMVRVFGRNVTLPGERGAGMRTARIGNLAIARYEVTNEEYQRFVTANGYGRRELWEPFVANGRPLTWEEGIRRFVDRTGRPGPATWEGGTFSQGQARFPVSGISWYEAMAYAKFAGMSLPNIHQWRAAAGPGRMPFIVPLSNIGTANAGPLAVGSKRGMSVSGALDMAGNVREWVINPDGTRRFILGGGWNDVPWTFTHMIAVDPFDRAPTNGMRLAKSLGAEPDRALLEAAVIRGRRDYARERPRPEAELVGFRRAYGYDPAPLNATIESADSSDAAWIRQTILFNAAYGSERVRMQLLLPRNARPPYQTVVYMPGANALNPGSSLQNLGAPAFMVASGRAVAYPVVKNTFERFSDAVNWISGPVHNMSGEFLGPNSYRDEIVMVIKDVRRSIDYLATRSDIDTTKIAYAGTSWGGRLAPLALAVEPRFKLALLYIPGLMTAPRLPEVDEINFLPQVRVPTLVLSGRYDDVFPLENTVLPFVQGLGVTEEHKRHVVYPTGHTLPRAGQIAESLNWLDRYFGTVAR
ncbi:MAG: protein kinase [Gemmatimonadaceae bacterium]